MLNCMERRRVLFYLYLGLTLRDERGATAYIVRALESTEQGSAEYADVARILATADRCEQLDEIDAVMGMLEIEQAIAGQDRGTRQCAATRRLNRTKAKCP